MMLGSVTSAQAANLHITASSLGVRHGSRGSAVPHHRLPQQPLSLLALRRRQPSASAGRAARNWRRTAPRAAAEDEAAGAPTTAADGQPKAAEGDDEKADLAARLAAAEAEAAALRRALEERRAPPGSLLRAKPNSDVFIDGTGARETIFEGPKLTGKSARGGRSWGLTEADLLAARAEGGELLGEADDGDDVDPKEAEGIVRRRLLIGGALAVAALPLALFDIPLTIAPPSKPLFFYVAPLVRLKLALDDIVKQADALDALSFRSQLRYAIGSIDTVRDNLVNATVLLESERQAATKQLAFEIVDYLQQANYSNYFDNLGEPSPSQQLEFLQFSLKSIKAARTRLVEFLSNAPPEVVESATRQFTPAPAADEDDSSASSAAVPSGSDQRLGDATEALGVADAEPDELYSDDYSDEGGVFYDGMDDVSEDDDQEELYVLDA